MPSTEEEWLAIASDFMARWNFPNCVGALDGKHVTIQAPPHTGSVYYKHFYSIVLMALVDAKYRFIMVDVGANGRACDAGIFARYAMSNALDQNTVHLPRPCPLPGRINDVPWRADKVLMQLRAGTKNKDHFRLASSELFVASAVGYAP